MRRFQWMVCCVVLCAGCATPPGRPYAIVQGGLRMPTNQACRISDVGTRLLPCTMESSR